MKRSAAEILREYGPFPGVDSVHGVTYDGQHVWFASGDKLNAFDPASGKTVRSIDVAGHAGTAFDGQHLFQLAEDRIQKIDPKTGRVLATIPAPGGGGDSGLAWAEGTLWVGQYRHHSSLWTFRWGLKLSIDNLHAETRRQGPGASTEAILSEKDRRCG